MWRTQWPDLSKQQTVTAEAFAYGINMAARLFLLVLRSSLLNNDT